MRLVSDENGAIRSYQMLPAAVTNALFGALAARDQGCRWPGCRKAPIYRDGTTETTIAPIHQPPLPHAA
jgi:hypothetical protein